MQFSDYVWFYYSDDCSVGTCFQDDMEKHAGRIVIKMNEKSSQFAWIVPLPITYGDALPLWSIPKNRLTRMTQDEIMLNILER